MNKLIMSILKRKTEIKATAALQAEMAQRALDLRLSRYIDGTTTAA